MKEKSKDTVKSCESCETMQIPYTKCFVMEKCIDNNYCYKKTIKPKQDNTNTGIDYNSELKILLAYVNNVGEPLHSIMSTLIKLIQEKAND